MSECERERKEGGGREGVRGKKRDRGERGNKKESP